MPLSTFNSDVSARPSRAAVASALLIASALLCLGAAEFVCRYVVPRISRIERRITDEYNAALQAGRLGTSGTQVLVVGNSLLDCAFDFDAARRSLAPQIDARRLVVESTDYLDWYYGLQRLHTEGSRPHVVVLVLSPDQFVANSIRGDYFAYRLMRSRDLPAVASDARLSNTEASSLVFANLSAFYGVRTEMRKWLAGKVFPDFAQLTAWIRKYTPSRPTREHVYSVTAERMRAIEALGARDDVRIVYLVPPMLKSFAANVQYQAFQDAAAAVHATVLVPLEPGCLERNCFSDGFHLNSRGILAATPPFVKSLRGALLLDAAERKGQTP